MKCVIRSLICCLFLWPSLYPYVQKCEPSWASLGRRPPSTRSRSMFDPNNVAPTHLFAYVFRIAD